MHIVLEDIGKRYNREWIFKGLHREFLTGTQCAILGGNGSGKSTLLQILSGYLSPSAGSITWQHLQHTHTSETIYQHVTLATPALSLYDDFTLRENIQFFRQFKAFRNQVTLHEIAEQMQLEKHLDKPLKHYSSGMRQRVKLGLAILADSPLLLLDEPTSHLDARATQWFQNLLQANLSNRTLFVASNSHEEEIFLCTSRVLMDELK